MCKDDHEEMTAYFSKRQTWLDQGAIEIQSIRRIKRRLRRGVSIEDVGPSELKCVCGHDLTIIDQAHWHTSAVVYSETRIAKLLECDSCSQRYTLELASNFTGFL